MSDPSPLGYPDDPMQNTGWQVTLTQILHQNAIPLEMYSSQVMNGYKLTCVWQTDSTGHVKSLNMTEKCLKHLAKQIFVITEL